MYKTRTMHSRPHWQTKCALPYTARLQVAAQRSASPPAVSCQLQAKPLAAHTTADPARWHAATHTPGHRLAGKDSICLARCHS